MVRKAARCPCGWTFFVEEDLAIVCPMCRRDLNAPSASPQGRGAPPARSLDKAFLVVALTLTLVLIAGIPLLLYWSDSRPGRSSTTFVPWSPNVPGEVVDRPARGHFATFRSVPPLPANPADPEDSRVGHVLGLVRAMNATCLAAEHARLLGDRARGDLLATRLRVLREFANAEIASLRGEKISVPLPEHLEPDDRLTTLQGIELARLNPSEAATAIRVFAENAPPEIPVPVTVRRGNEDVRLHVEFPAMGADLRTAFAETRASSSLGPPLAATPDRPTPARPLRAPQALHARVEQMLREVPDYYVSMVSIEDFEKVQAILQEGARTKDDEDYVNRICDYVYYHYREETAAIEHELKHARKDIERPSQRDLVTYADGSRRSGTVVSESDDEVTVETVTHKVRGSRTYPRGEITKIERGAGVGSQVKSKIQSCAGDLVLLGELMTWCRQNGLAREAECVALTILLGSPDDEAARTTLGFRRNASGIWEMN